MVNSSNSSAFYRSPAGRLDGGKCRSFDRRSCSITMQPPFQRMYVY